jgi:hypothetical protein
VRLNPEQAVLPPLCDKIPLPKELYVGLKPGAWRSASVKGLYPRTHKDEFTPLFVKVEMAQRVAKRFTGEIILIKVLAQKAHNANVAFTPYGDTIWLTPFVPAEFLVGPKINLEEEKPEPKPKPKAQDLQIPDLSLLAGPEPSKGKKKGKYSDSPIWKTQTRKDRRGRGGGTKEEK